MDKNITKVAEACEWITIPSGLLRSYEWIRTASGLLRHVNG